MLPEILCYHRFNTTEDLFFACPLLTNGAMPALGCVPVLPGVMCRRSTAPGIRICRRFRNSSVSESVAVAFAEAIAESGHYNIDSTAVRARILGGGPKRKIINGLFADRLAGTDTSMAPSATRPTVPMRFAAVSRSESSRPSSGRNQTAPQQSATANGLERVTGHRAPKINRAVATRCGRPAVGSLGNAVHHSPEHDPRKASRLRLGNSIAPPSLHFPILDIRVLAHDT